MADEGKDPTDPRSTQSIAEADLPSPLRTTPPKTPPQQPPNPQNPKKHETTKPRTRTRAKSRSPPTLVVWARSDEGLELLERSAIGMGRVLVVDPNYANTKSTVVELSGE